MGVHGNLNESCYLNLGEQWPKRQGQEWSKSIVHEDVEPIPLFVEC